jgi:macrolide-specific efflux system membrane fusion protein
MPRFIALHRRSLLIVIGLLLAVAAYLLYPARQSITT